MFYLPHRLRIVLFLTTLCLIGVGAVALYSGFTLDLSLGIALAGFLVLAAGYAISTSRVSLSFLHLSPAGIAPASTAELNSPMRDMLGRTAPSLATPKQLPSTLTSTFQVALSEWIGIPSNFESELRELLSAMSEVILVLDADGRYLKIAPTNPSLLYRPSEELIGKTLHQVFPQSQADFFLAQVRRALESHERVSFEYALTMDSNEYWFATTVSPLTESSVLWVARDVTPSRNAGNALRENEERFRALIEKSQDVITILDERGQALYRTPSAARITGYSDSEREQSDMFRLIHPEDLSRAQELFDEIRRQPATSVSAQLRIKHKDGTWRWIEVTATNHLDDASVRGIVVNYRDITEPKHREEELQRRHLELAALFQIGQSLARLAPLSEILETVYWAMSQALDNRNLYIALYDEATQEISFPLYMIDGKRRSPFARAFGNGITEYIVRTKAPLYLAHDLQEELNMRGIDFIGRPARSYLGVPMLSGDKTIGVIAVQDYECENAYESNHVKLLSTIASQVASAIENARLYDEAHNRAGIFGALYQTTHALSLSNDLPTLLQSVVENAGALLNVSVGGILLYDAERNVLEFAAVVGLPVVPTPLRPDEGFAGHVFQTREAFAIENYSQWGNRAQQFENSELQAMVGVPLIYRGEAIGVLQFGEVAPSTRKFAEADKRLLSLFAAQVAGAVHSAHLFVETRKRAEELAALHETTKDLSSLHDLPQLLQAVVDRATALFQVSGGGVYLYNAAENNLHMVIAKGFAVPIGTRLEMGEGMAGKVAQTRQPMIADKYQNWEGRSRQFDNIPFESVLEVPMLYSGELVGILVVHTNTETSRKFTEQDARLLSLFASQAAGAVRTARLLANVTKHAAESSALYETTRLISAANQDLSIVIQTIVDQTAKLLKAQTASLYLYDAVSQVMELKFFKDFPGKIGNKLKLGEGTAGLIAQTLEPIVLENYHTWEGRSPIYEQVEFSAMASVPMLYQGNLIGVLSIAEIGDTKRKFSSEDVHLLSLLAGQAASTIHSARLFETVETERQQLQLLYDVARQLTLTLDPQEIIEQAVALTTRSLNGLVGVIYMYEPETKRLHLRALAGRPDLAVPSLDAQMELHVGEGLAGAVAAQRASVLVEDVTQNASWRFIPGLDEEVRSAIAVPIQSAGKLLGVLTITHTSPGAFSAEHLALLDALSGQIAIALANAYLLAETKNRADQMALLYDAGLTLNRVLDPKLQLEFLVKLAAQTLKAERAIFYRYDPTQHKIQAEMAVGYDPETLKKILHLQFSLDRESTIPGWVLQNRLAVNLGDVNADPRYIPIDSKVGSGLWVPIEHESLPRGVLCVFSPRLHAFTVQSERLLTLYANQVSTAMGNAELFGEIKQRLVELEAINQLSTALRAARTRSEMLPLFLKQTLALFETDAGVIWLYNPLKREMEQATASGWFSNLHELPIGPGEGIAGHVFATGEAYVSREFLNDPLTRKISALQVPAGWGGTCVPIRSADKTVGVLFVAVPLPRQMNQPQVRLLTTLAEIAGNTIHRMRLHESLEETFVQTVAALAYAIDARDTYTAGHSNTVSDLAVKVANEMSLNRDLQETIRLGGLLHDIGKIAIPDAILHKPARLTPEEYALVKTHPRVGAQILKPIKQLEYVVPIVLSHQERFDGTGYPDGLAGESIPIGARILAVVDAFSSITDNRSYRLARTEAEALSEIKQWSGKQFDPEVVRAFQGLFKKRS